ncbi:RNA polymerase factor sigma-54 [Reichenbachiella agariperforans]|uniref:RNA polymerase factor sigma-54 n=1 Tax=Reichenbachiella agariperforans TaxID=156994 RepID=UPI001C08BA0C|nr:RNA polymerase factor sigma-54 [Reichenbachiella agariperforans]MBU2915569.1 RNA polymerase factor sigma-54 [Reichenbachiella agariperforans]
MQKLGLIQSLGQKLSPQQIQFIKLLQVPTAELEARIKEEMEVNPALEEGKDDDEEVSNEEERAENTDSDELNVDDYLNEDDYAGYKMQGDGNHQEEEREMPISSGTSLQDQLIVQLGFLKLDETQEIIGRQLIGSIESDGYIRRDLEAIMNDLAFSQNIETSLEELEEILTKIQGFDPAGIAARSLQECLMIQLEKKEVHGDEVDLALKIVGSCFEEFTKKHYDKIIKKLDITDEALKDAIHMITKLNPKPGGTNDSLVRIQYLLPDFILTNDDGKLELTLNSKNAPELKVSRSYSDMFQSYHKSDKKDKKLKETVSFVKQKLDAAKWFIDAVKQRQQTLLNTMNAIIKYQYDFFLDGDESKLRPMILKDIAEIIGMDISTISRVANSKSIQTEFGIFPLKYFFSEGIATDSGEDVSSREVKLKLKTFIENEDKSKPLSDDKLEKLLKAEGYNIARRTVAKYREQLNLPVARLRKEL